MPRVLASAQYNYLTVGDEADSRNLHYECRRKLSVGADRSFEALAFSGSALVDLVDLV